MAPRRHRSTSNVHGPVQTQSVPPPTQRTQTPAAPTQRELSMEPEIYESNMKVLSRRIPSLTSIIDQFSHVCIYNHNGQKWERYGYEGTMFLLEKSSYPTYSFIILNRQGTKDYLKHIYPEDDMEIIGDYLMYRFYPDFTKTRVEMGLPYPIPPEHRDAFDRELSRRISPPEETGSEKEKEKETEKKGQRITLGLWMYSTDAREPLKEVMMRLHSYVKRGAPYPDEYKYGPGRPPPPNPHLRNASRSSAHTSAQDQGNASGGSQYNGASHNQAPTAEQMSAATTGAGSELDKLFSKLIPPSASAPLPTAPANIPATAKSVHDLFASLGGTEMGTRSVPPPQPQLPPQPAPQPVQEPPPTRAQALLMSMFASVATPSTSSTSMYNISAQAPPPPQPEEVTIVSPKPTSSALPQILNQDVISTLLGLGSDSRASSAAPSTTSSRRSNQNKYEGDNEYSEGDGASDGLPHASHTKANGRVPSLPTFSVQPVASSESETEDGGRPASSRRVPGDVTPRPPAGGLRLPPTSPSQGASTPTASLSAPNLNGHANGTGRSGTPRERPLIPFDGNNSELWPYPRAPLDDRSFENEDVVELDFADTRALSDPAIFSSRLKETQQKKGKKGKKSKKEREEESQRERAEIERGWDMPERGHEQPPYPPTAKTAPIATAAAAAAPAPVLRSAVPRRGAVPAVNGSTNGVQPANSPKQMKKAAANGSNAPNQTNGHARSGSLDSIAAKDAILSAMLSQKGSAHPPALGKNDFVRELLTLIHTDSQFVDGLWRDYLTRTT